MRNRNQENLQTISIRVEASEKEILLKRAEEEGFTLSEYSRLLITHRNDKIGRLAAIPQELIVSPEIAPGIKNNVLLLKKSNPAFSTEEIIEKSLALAAHADTQIFSLKIKKF